MEQHCFLPKKHRIFFGAAIILISGLLAYCLFSYPGTALFPRHVTLTWTGDPQTTQTITWQTGSLLLAGQQVQYSEEAKAGSFPQQSRIISAAGEILATNKGKVAIHSVALTGLEPDTRYVYRVGNGLIWSKSHTFATSPVNVPMVKFLLFGDSQGSKYDDWRATLTKASQANPDAVFLMHAGDLVDVGLDYGQWNDWFSAGSGIIDRIPVMPVMGNHETYTSEWKIAQPEFYTALLKLPANGPAELRGKVYSFDYGPVHFSILNSQEQEEREFIPDILRLQQTWLEQDLQSADKKWKLVLIHRPLYHNRPSAGDEELRDAFAPLIDKYHVDAVFSGHDHAYARSYPITNGMWAKGSQKAEGTVYITAGRSGTKTFSRALAKDWDEVFYNPMDEPNYLTVEVTPARLTVKAFKQNGDLIDDWSVSK